MTYPLVDDEVADFCAGKKAVLIVEEGQPEFIEQAVNTILRRRDIGTKIAGKDVLPMAGEYTAEAMLKGVRAFLANHAPAVLSDAARAPNEPAIYDDPRVKALSATVPPRPPGFCTGCPERPIFAAMKLVEKELGPHHVSGDIGCHLFSILPPFNIGTTTMGYGLGPASAAAFNVEAGKKSISIMGDGGFWHNGLTSSVGNAVYNKHDGVIMVVDNYYSAATGGQDILSSRADIAIALDPTSDRAGGRRRRRQVGAADRPHLRRRQDARHPEGGADHALAGPEGDRRVLRMHAEQAAAAKAVVQQGGQHRASGSCASASASTRTSAPATTPASASPAAPR